ncbi:hypothetical protein DAI22_12g057300 [Oryza sativa Japonica Group]|nr:hypothetical protein DAI22_12g057300 [Oryza sativa Japonica Group]
MLVQFPHTRLGLSCSSPSADFIDWWLTARKSVAKVDRKTFDAGVILVTWLIWKERNARVFDGIAATVPELCSAMGDEWETRMAAGLVSPICHSVANFAMRF